MTVDERSLYGLHPSAFVSARNELAKAAKRNGHKEEASRLAKLVKPSPSVWAVNQLARNDPAELASYLESHHRARDRQLRALAEPEDPEARQLAETSARHERRLLDVLVEAAVQHLKDAELSTSKAVLDRVRTNLRAAVVERTLLQRLEEGWLAHDLEEPGFKSLTAALEDAPPDWLERELARLHELKAKAGRPADAPKLHVVPPPGAADNAEEERMETARRAEAEARKRQEEERRQKILARQRAEEAVAQAAAALEAAEHALKSSVKDRSRAESAVADLAKSRDDLVAKLATVERDLSEAVDASERARERETELGAQRDGAQTALETAKANLEKHPEPE